MADELPRLTSFVEIAVTVRNLCAIFHASVTSNARTRKRNAAVGGVDDSYHLLERGALGWDLVPDNPADQEPLAAAARRCGLKALVEGDHVHLQP